MNLNFRTFQVTLTNDTYNVSILQTFQAVNLASLCKKITEAIGTAELNVTSIKEIN